MSDQKLFAGQAVRRVRRAQGLTQGAMAEALEISASYLNLIERNQRPLTAMLVLMLTSKGMAGVPGSSFLALSATISAIGHGSIPVAAVALLLGADRIMDSMRVSVNLIGNCVATFVVAAWEGELDKERMALVLAGQPVPPLEETNPITGEKQLLPEEEGLGLHTVEAETKQD